MQGGGGFEVWQHTGKKPELPSFQPKMGDIGIYITKLKTADIEGSFRKHSELGLELLSGICQDPHGRKHYFIRDPYNNIFQLVEEAFVYQEGGEPNGGVFGVIIGVSNLEKSLAVYKDILEYDVVIYDQTSVFSDLFSLPNGGANMRRVCLKHSKVRKGGFAPMLGPTEIELVQLTESKGRNIYENRIWGDPGFIHLCFDIIGMDKLKKECTGKGFPFTVDSSTSFDMGEAAGHFSYISDPDGIPIEFVEAHKVPIIKKLGWYMKLKNRNPGKSLPDWMIKTLRWKRVKD